MGNPRIIVDSRELNSGVVKELDRINADVDIQTLEIGDYLCSNRVAIERKTAEDALNSFIGDEKGKIFRQCKDLADSYRRPLLMLECDLNDLFVRNIHPGAIWGMLRSIIWNGCPIEFTYTAEGTAKRLYELAAAEQIGNKKAFSPHGSKTKRTLSEQKLYIVSAVPDVGPVVAKALLEHFGSVKRVFTAEKEELIQVPKVGDVTADKIIELIGGKYDRH